MDGVHEYDVIVVGTGLVESIVAAACARAGKQVLYVDDQKWYGGDSATLSLAETLAFHQGKFLSEISENELTPEAISRLSGGSLASLKSLGTFGEPPNARESDFNIDLTARLLFCRGPGVDAIAESGVSRYLEFQPFEGCFYLAQMDSAKPIVIPHSKNQVFSSGDLSMVEKRQLMRFLQFCMDYRNQEDVEWTNERLGASAPGRSLSRPQNKSEDSELKSKALNMADSSLTEFLKNEVRMTPRLVDVVRYGIAHQRSAFDQVKVNEGMTRIGAYLNALGRFGQTPFLTPMYGIGEICQGFSRLCAVYGGTCALGVRPSALSKQGVFFEDSTSKDSYAERLPHHVKARLACVVSSSFLSAGDALFPGVHEVGEVRSTFIVSKPLFDRTTARSVFVVEPKGSDSATIVGIQLDSKTKTVPENYYLVVLVAQCIHTGESVAQTKSEMQAFVQSRIDENGVLWGSFVCKTLNRASSLVSEWNNLFIVGDVMGKSNACLSMDIDDAFTQAKNIFSKIAPGEAFLPPSESELQARKEEIAMSAVPDIE